MNEMKVSLSKLLSWSILIALAVCLLPQCTKEDYGLTKEARESIERLQGDYSCHLAAWSPKNAKSGLLVLVDTTEAKTLESAVLAVEGKDEAGDEGSVRAEVPFHHLVSVYSTFFNAPASNSVRSFPKSWEVTADYEVDSRGEVSFSNYEYAEIDGCSLDVSFDFDQHLECVTLMVQAGIDDEEKIDMGDFLNTFFSGQFRIIYRKN